MEILGDCLAVVVAPIIAGIFAAIGIRKLVGSLLGYGPPEALYHDRTFTQLPTRLQTKLWNEQGITPKRWEKLTTPYREEARREEEQQREERAALEKMLRKEHHQ